MIMYVRTRPQRMYSPAAIQFQYTVLWPREFELPNNSNFVELRRPYGGQTVLYERSNRIVYESWLSLDLITHTNKAHRERW